MSKTGEVELEVIGIVGEARLFRLADGKLRIEGGSERERTELTEWVSACWKDGPTYDVSATVISPLTQSKRG